MYKPGPDEYDPYYFKYISLVPETDIREAFSSQPAHLRTALNGVSEDRGTFSYAEGKWTVKEVLSHLIDGERIFAYRMLRISRGDVTPIEGFEQDGYIENSNANNRTFTDLLNRIRIQPQSQHTYAEQPQRNRPCPNGNREWSADFGPGAREYFYWSREASFKPFQGKVSDMTKRTEKEIAKKLEPYLYVRDHGVHSYEEYKEFVDKFPDCSDTLVMAVISKIIKEKRGVGLFGE